MPTIPGLWRQRQKNQKFKVILKYRVSLKPAETAWDTVSADTQDCVRGVLAIGSMDPASFSPTVKLMTPLWPLPSPPPNAQAYGCLAAGNHACFGFFFQSINTQNMRCEEKLYWCMKEGAPVHLLEVSQVYSYCWTLKYLRNYSKLYSWVVILLSAKRGSKKIQIL